MPSAATVPPRAGSLLVALAGVVALAAAAASGWWLAGALRERPPADRQPPVVSVGDARVELPPDWTPVRAAGSTAVTTFAPAPGLAARALIAAGPAGDASLLPAALRPLLPDALPAPRRATLAGRRAWHFGPVERSGQRIEVTVAPTTAGAVAVACSAPPEVWSAALGCATGVRRISSASAALAPATDLAFRRRAAGALRRLDARRVALRAALGRSRGSSGRAATARRLARAHRTAAAALAPLAADGASSDAVSALRRVAAGYERLAKAARRRDRDRFVAARRSVAAADAALARALARLRAAS